MLQEHLVLHLRKEGIVVMDNLCTHKVSGVQEAIEPTGASMMYLLTLDFYIKKQQRLPLFRGCRCHF